MRLVMNGTQYRTRQLTQRGPSRLPLALAFAGLLLLGAALFLYVRQNHRAEAAAGFSPADVAREDPFVARHEMGEGPAIPFLPAAGPQPDLIVPVTRHDFGRIGPQDKVEKTFIVRNAGGAPLTISRAYTTCGCTTAEFSARIIPPGKVATVHLVFDAGYHDAAGQTVRRGLIIENNDPDQPQAEIWVQAAVNAR